MFEVILDPRVFPNRRKVFVCVESVDIQDNQVRIVIGSGEVFVLALSDWRVDVHELTCDYFL